LSFREFDTIAKSLLMVRQNFGAKTLNLRSVFA
jgi:hypothetical protein